MPTWASLREIEQFKSVDSCLAWVRGRRVHRRQPKWIEENGVQMLAMPGDRLNPEEDAGGAATVPFETRFVMVDGRWRPQYILPS